MSEPAYNSSAVKQWRTQVALWAYAYEVHNESIVSDAEFDARCARVASTLHVATDCPILDKWFNEHFDASTGMWVHKHPHKDKLEKLYQRVKGVLSQ